MLKYEDLCLSNKYLYEELEKLTKIIVFLANRKKKCTKYRIKWAVTNNHINRNLEKIELLWMTKSHRDNIEEV